MPSTTQLELMRFLVGGIATDCKRDKLKGLSSDTLAELQDFVSVSFYYKYVADLGGMVDQCADVGDLWFREFFLELSHEIQFPIKMSLPWILVEHLVSNSSSFEASSAATCHVHPHRRQLRIATCHAHSAPSVHTDTCHLCLRR